MLAALWGCGGEGEDDDEERLRPATAEECPNGGTVLERGAGQNDVVCEGDVADPQNGPCEDLRQQIADALGREVRSGLLSADSVACGPAGIESGVVEVEEGIRISMSQQQELVGRYQYACAAMAAACQ